MSANAFLMIDTVAGKTEDVGRRLLEIPGVQSINMVTGPHDIIARIKAQDLQELQSSIVVEKVHQVPGITRTMTCVCIPQNS